MSWRFLFFRMNNIRKNILLIAGTGRNVGKTLFACQLINNLKCKSNLICIKISPHFHKISDKLELVIETADYVITKEYSKKGNKDSNRLFRAGSKEVYYVQGKDDTLPDILSYFEKIIPPENPIICESGGLRDLIVPGLFLMIDKKNNNQIKSRAIKYKQLADKKIEFNGEKFDFDSNKIAFTENGWLIKN